MIPTKQSKLDNATKANYDILPQVADISINKQATPNSPLIDMTGILGMRGEKDNSDLVIQPSQPSSPKS